MEWFNSTGVSQPRVGFLTGATLKGLALQKCSCMPFILFWHCALVLKIAVSKLVKRN